MLDHRMQLNQLLGLVDELKVEVEELQKRVERVEAQLAEHKSTKLSDL